MKDLYEAAIFRVWPEGRAGGAYKVRVGRTNEAFDGVLEQRGVRRWAVITAYNPGDERPGDDVNQRAQQRLVDELKGYVQWDAIGASPDDSHSEPSVFVCDVGVAEAREVGARYRQACVLVGEVGSPARLEWCGRET